MLIRGATAVLGGGIQRADIRIQEGRILAVAPELEPSSGEEIIEAAGLTVLPGLIDIHVHLREPGGERKETIETGTMSAVKGGFTQICCMPNTDPVIDDKVTVVYIKARAKEVGRCKVHPIGAITKGENGKSLAAMGYMAEEGAVGFSDDGKSVADSALMANAMLYAANFGKKCFCHCEDPALGAGADAHYGATAFRLGLQGSLRAAEDIMIARDILLAESLSLPVHICHVSTYSGVQLIREAKKRGVKVTAETCPHYFTLTDAALENYDTNAKVSPPLREEIDRKAVIEGLCDGTIDCIASDHAPHHADDKKNVFSAAPCGISGLETSFALSYTKLVKEGFLTLEELVKKMSAVPAQIAGLEGGTIEEGAPADLTLADLDEHWIVDPADFLSKGKNTPFKGMELCGRVKMTVVDGKIAYEEARG